MGNLFTQLFAKITAVIGWVVDLFLAAFTALYALFKDAFSWVFDSVLGVAVTAISSLDVSGITPYVSGAGNLPVQILNILSLLGVAQAVSIITAALVIRMALQLIPFVRLGS